MLLVTSLESRGETNEEERGRPTEPTYRAPEVPFSQARMTVLAQFERQYLRRLIHRTAGNISAAARAAGLDRKHLRELLKKHGLYQRRSKKE